MDILSNNNNNIYNNENNINSNHNSQNKNFKGLEIITSNLNKKVHF